MILIKEMFEIGIYICMILKKKIFLNLDFRYRYNINLILNCFFYFEGGSMKFEFVIMYDVVL